MSEGERQKLIEAICAHCGNTIQWQKRMPGDGCARGYWFNHATGSGCGKSDFGHERILGAEQPSQTRAAEVVRCHKCKGTLIYKRISEYEIEVYGGHGCAAAVPVEVHPLSDWIERFEAAASDAHPRAAISTAMAEFQRFISVEDRPAPTHELEPENEPRTRHIEPGASFGLPRKGFAKVVAPEKE